MCARVRLRQWEDSDLERFAEMNADADVMRFLPRPLTHRQSAASLKEKRRTIDRQGWGMWAVEVDGLFAGFTGLLRVNAEFSFGPAIEIGWCFRREYWGKGVALAAARDAETFAFQTLKLPELVSFTAAVNLPSRRLMERLGMIRDPEGDFLHPHLPKAHPLRPHVLYRKTWI